MHSVSVIVSNFNGSKYLPRLIATIKAQKGVEIELIVVDRNSSDESASILAEHSEIKVLHHPPETGLVSGYHFGTAAAAHSLYFFMNEDMWLEPHCLQKCCELMEQNERVASVMPVQWTYDGREIVNAGIWFEKCIWTRSCPILTRRSRWHLVEKPARVSYANAGACLVRKTAYDEVGGWDTTFFLDDEDTDLALRFWQRDWECWVHPDATVGHAVGASNAKALPKTGATVSKRRYVGALSNFIVLALKSFSPVALVLPMFAVADRFVRDIVKARWGHLALDCKALALTIQRLPEVSVFRVQNSTFNHIKPGQGFFFEKAFQWESIRDNVSLRKDVISTADQL